MAKVSIVVLADTETHGDPGRIANALTTAHECMDAGDEFEVLFDGAGTKWIAELSGRDHKLSPTSTRSGITSRAHATTARRLSASAARWKRPVSRFSMSTSSTRACAGGSRRGSRSSRSDSGHWNRLPGHPVGGPHEARRVAG